MKIVAKRVAEAAQAGGDHAEVLALGGERVHMGHCAEHDKECPHLSTPDGNVAIEDGDWLVKENEEFSILTDAAFQSLYAAS